MGGFMDWARILAYITGTVEQELLLRNEYLAAENRILKAQLKTPLRLTADAERVTLAEIVYPRVVKKLIPVEMSTSCQGVLDKGSNRIDRDIQRRTCA